MNIEFINEYLSYTFDQEDLFTQKIKHVFSNEKFEKEIDICIVFMTDNDLLEINREHLNHDFFTDIITFPIEETDDSLEADLYISIDRVKDNAKEFRVVFINELLRVVLHGCLHLCGYADKTQEQIKEMRAKENFYLSA